MVDHRRGVVGHAQQRVTGRTKAVLVDVDGAALDRGSGVQDHRVVRHGRHLRRRQAGDDGSDGVLGDQRDVSRLAGIARDGRVGDHLDLGPRCAGDVVVGGVGGGCGGDAEGGDDGDELTERGAHDRRWHVASLHETTPFRLNGPNVEMTSDPFRIITYPRNLSSG